MRVSIFFFLSLSTNKQRETNRGQLGGVMDMRVADAVPRIFDLFFGLVTHIHIALYTHTYTHIHTHTCEYICA